MEELKVKISADATDLKSVVSDADALLNKFRLEQETKKTNLQIDTFEFKKSIEAAKVLMRDAKKTGDRELELKLDLDIKDLKKKSADAKKSIRDIEKSINLSPYQKLTAELNKNRTAWKNLAAQNRENTAEGKKLLATTSRLDTQIKKIDSTVGQSQRNVGNYGSTFTKTGNAVKYAAGAMVAFVASLYGLISKSDQYIQIQNQLKQRTDGSAAATRQLTDEIFAMANDSRVPVNELSKAYQRFDVAIVSAGGSSEETKVVLDSVTKSLSLMGASGAETGSVMLQLSQAFGSGVLRGEEFNSINEAAPSLIRAIAKEMKVETGEMKNLASQGKITADIVKKALINSNEEIVKNFEGSTKTFGQSVTIMSNTAIKEFGELDEKIGANKTFSGFVESFTESIPAMVTVIGSAVNTVGAIFTGLYSVVEPVFSVIFELFGEIASKVQSVATMVSSAWAEITEVILKYVSIISNAARNIWSDFERENKTLSKGIVTLGDFMKGFSKFLTSTFGKSIVVVTALILTYNLAVWASVTAMGAFTTAIGVGAIKSAIISLTSIVAVMVGMEASFITGTILAGTFWSAVFLPIAAGLIAISAVAYAISTVIPGAVDLAGAFSNLREQSDKLVKSLNSVSGERFKKEAEQISQGVDDMKSSMDGFFEDEEDFDAALLKTVNAMKKANTELGKSNDGLNAVLEQNSYLKTLGKWYDAAGVSDKQRVEMVTNSLNTQQFTLNRDIEQHEIHNKELEKAYGKFQEIQGTLSFQESIDKIRDASKATDEEFSIWLDNMGKTAIESGDLAAAINFGISNGMSNEQGLKMIRDAGDTVSDEVFNALIPSMQDTITDTIKIQEDGINAIGSLVPGATETGGKVMAALNSGMNAQLPTLTKILNTAINGVRKFVSKTSEFVPGLEGMFGKVDSFLSNISIPEIDVSVKGADTAVSQVKAIYREGTEGATMQKRSVKNLRDEVSELQKKYDEADIGSENFKRLGKELKSVQSELDGVGKSAKKSGGSSSRASKQATEDRKKEADELKRLTSEQKEYSKEITDTEKTFEDLAKATTDYYDELEGNINNAKKSQEELTKSLEDYKKEQRNDITKDFAEKDVELSDEKISLEKEVTELDPIEGKERLLEINAQLLAIEEERAKIADFIAQKGTEEQFQATKDFQALSEIEQAIQEFENLKSIKEQEVQLEIDTQKRIEEINQKILNTSFEGDRAQERAKNRLRIQEAKGRLANEEIISESLKALGLEDLTEEERLYAIKQIALGDNLNRELAETSRIQQEILDEKTRFFEMTEKIYSDSIDVQKAKTQELIEQIKQAANAQRTLNSLRGQASASSSVSNTSNTTNNNITQNISSQSEADYFANAVQKAK